jgi:hypothetical protein
MNNRIRIAIISVLAIVACGALVWLPQANEIVVALLEWVESFGPWGPVLFVFNLHLRLRAVLARVVVNGRSRIHLRPGRGHDNGIDREHARGRCGVPPCSHGTAQMGQRENCVDAALPSIG